jgi:hypothetical protein
LNVDLNGDGVFDLSHDDLLFFEPAYQTPASGNPSLPDQGPALLATWQHWNALAGGWWSLHGLAAATPGNGVKLLQHYVAVQPQATIMNASSGGGVRIVVGFGEEQDEFEGHVDTFTIGVDTTDITYNFAAGPITIWAEIDIAPGDYPNAIDSHSPEVVTVAILSTPEVSTPQDVDPTSLTFGRVGDEPSLEVCHPSAEDVNDDGLIDLVCAIRIALTAWRCDDTEGALQGQLFDGRFIQGADSVMAEPCL